MNNPFLPRLESTIESIRTFDIPADRQMILQPVIAYIQNCWAENKVPQLNFICTHNSRRSQFSQIWAQAFAHYFDVPFRSFSGGVEVTAMNERAVMSLQRAGFKVRVDGDVNPNYYFRVSDQSPEILAFSKVYDDPINPTQDFAAIMTCSDADENCPFIPGADARLPVRYQDPKISDDTPQEEEIYDTRSHQIAAELHFVFKNALNH